jgi:hypothetical protein
MSDQKRTKKKAESNSSEEVQTIERNVIIESARSSLLDLILDSSIDGKDHAKALELALKIYLNALVSDNLKSKFRLLFLWSNSSISDAHRDHIYRGLINTNRDEENPVLLFIQSSGGSIEPAYQIAKACHKHSNGKFVVCIPREAKSAATLIALGADEIHMGDLSQLGPVDPQINGLPALGLKDSLREIAKIAGEIPNAQMMFSHYLRNQMNLQYFGWASRISDSAIQYGEKLLSLKHAKGVSFNKDEARLIADRLVNHYKDHGFVIDSDEASAIFNKDGFVKIDTQELYDCEEIYEGMRLIIAGLNFLKNLKLELVGGLDDCLRIEQMKTDV